GRARRQGVLLAGRAHRERDRGAGARRDRQHVGVHRTRLPAARVAVGAVVRRRRGPTERPPTRTTRGSRWTSVTPRPRPTSAPAFAPGWPPTTRVCPRRRPRTSTGPVRPSGTPRSTAGDFSD